MEDVFFFIFIFLLLLRFVPRVLPHWLGKLVPTRKGTV